MEKDNGYYRYQHKKHALRHKRITEEVYLETNFFNIFNKYDSFKIHCSCPMCARKRNNKGAYAFYNGADNLSIADRRRQEEMDYELEDLTFDEIDV